jgi:thiamine pyrophosphokinase
MTIILNEILSGEYKSILCLNGDLPEYDLFKHIKLPIIAADGASNKLLSMHIIPEIVIGDLDSIDEAIKQKLNVLEIKDQSRSDFEKSYEYLRVNKLLPSIIFGINGGYIDHVLNNINILGQIENCIIYSSPIVGYIINAGNTKILQHFANAKISLIPLSHKAVVTTKGLKWELNDAELNFLGNNSAFNRGIENMSSITVSSGKIIVLIYDVYLEDDGCKLD